MKENIICYCCSGKSFEICCEKFINAEENPVTAEELMRFRYTAHVLAKIKYLIDTVHPQTSYFHNQKSILKWIKEN